MVTTSRTREIEPDGEPAYLVSSDATTDIAVACDANRPAAASASVAIRKWERSVFMVCVVTHRC